MASRATGALLGLAAAVLFAVSVLSPKLSAKLPAWWDGHPTVDGKTYDRMDGHVGMLGAARCFDGERCTSLEVGGGFAAVSYGELGVVLLAELLAIALAISIWTIGDRRKGIARVALVVGVVAAAGSAVMVLIGPGVHASQEGKPLLVEVPIGTGFVLFWLGLAANAAAAFIAPRVKREPLRLRTPAARPMPGPPTPGHATPQPVDFRELLRDQHDSLRPSVRGPEPMLGAPQPPANRGSIPAGSPLFEAAPQLRPLYDMQGAPPVVAPVAMPPAPEPLPRASMRQLAGIDTPPPERTGPPPGPPPMHGMPAPDGAPPRGGFVPPPLAPPPTPLSTQALAREREPSPSQPPPLRVPTLADSSLRAGSAGKIPARPPGRQTQPPPPRPQRPTQPTEPPPIKDKDKKRTVAHAVPPPPSPDSLPPPPKLPAPTSARASRVTGEDGSDVRPEAVARLPRKKPASQAEPNTTVEIDAEAKAKAKAAAGKPAREVDERAPTAAISGRMGAMAAAVPISTAEERAMAADDLLAARDELGDVGSVGDHTDQVSAAGLGDVDPHTGVQPVVPPLPDERPGTADGAPADTGTIQTPPEPAPTSEMAAAPAPTSELPAASPEPTASHPLSTAPSSLPPPKSVSTPSGPTPACPQCEAPMAWVEEHLRFYCKQCRMYF